MGPYDTTSLAIAVSKAGGIGLISTVGMGTFHMPGIGEFKYSAIFGEGTPDELLTRCVEKVLAELSDYPEAKFGINIPVSEEFIPTAGLIVRTITDRIKNDPETKKKCEVIVTSAGDPLPWSVDPQERKIKESIPLKKECPGITWCHVVPSVRAAKRAEKADVDVIIASGREGGAHCSWRDTSSLVLVPEVVKTINKPVIAAGGFADGRSLIAALSLGAIGIQMGTRFIATQESDFAQGWKEALIHATEEDTLVARGFFGPMRFVRNNRAIDLVDATLRGAPDLYKGIPTGSSQEILDLEVDGLQNLFKDQLAETPILGGIVTGRIHDIPTVNELIDGIMTEAESVLEGLRAGQV
jgi:NAD(P)H-dependent flavin oxidoreductase YrpB (nitropropane dioxygenase family)